MVADIVQLTRPFTLIMPALSFISAAIVALGSSPRPVLSVDLAVSALAGAVAMSLLAGAANALNQIFDVREDSVNKPFRPLPSRRLHPGIAWLTAIVLGLSSWTLMCLTPFTTRILLALILVGVVAYSVPPVRTKGRGWWANITIAMARGLFLRLAGWSVSGTLLAVEPWFIGGVFCFFLCGAASTKDFSDLPGDRQFNVRTLLVTLGPQRGARAMAPFFFLPWMLLVLGASLGILGGNALPLQALGLGLAAWGAYVALFLLPSSERRTDGNHVSWKHMYLMLMAADGGLALIYAARLIGGS